MTAGDGYFYIGAGLRRVYMNSSIGPGETRLYLRINDDRPETGQARSMSRFKSGDSQKRQP
jgi:hypothetical protein